MLKRLDTKRLNVVVALVLFCTTLIGYFYTNHDFVASAIWPTTGFAVALYYAHGRKSLPGIIIGILAANLLARFFLLNDSVVLALSYSAVFTLGNVVQVIMYNKMIPVVSTKALKALKNGLIFIGVAVIVSIFGALISVSFIYLTNTSINFIETASRWAFGDFTGIAIFSVVIALSYFYDKKFVKSRNYMIISLIYILFFTGFSYVIFSDTFSAFTFNQFSFLFMLFFFATSFFFSYRMILTIDMLYVLMYQLFLINTSAQGDLGVIVFSLNAYLFMLSSIAVVTKMVLYNLEHQNIELEESNAKFENLLDSTTTLFKLSDELLHENIEIDENYLVQMFNIAATVFDNFDYASCYIKSKNEVKFIAAIGYDVDIINTFFDDMDKFEWDYEIPIMVTDGEETVKNKLDEKYEEFTKIYPAIRQSIRFNIYVEEGVVGGMSFDVMINSTKTFSQIDLNNFKSYQKLMNSFYAVNYLNYKNNNLKNDIVLSLIRTLELYDHYTGGHSEEVAYLAREIAVRMGLNEKEVYNIYWAGIVHDIGKVGIPSNIINKPEKLTLEEYAQVKDHPVFGYQILSKSEDLKDIALLVKHHHEWWNGEGYPDGQKGNVISVGAQILCICDSVSSMATVRPYSPTKSSKSISDELELYRGIQFAPGPTDEMIKFIKEGLLDDFYKEK